MCNKENKVFIFPSEIISHVTGSPQTHWRYGNVSYCQYSSCFIHYHQVALITFCVVFITQSRNKLISISRNLIYNDLFLDEISLKNNMVVFVRHARNICSLYRQLLDSDFNFTSTKSSEGFCQFCVCLYQRLSCSWSNATLKTHQLLKMPSVVHEHWSFVWLNVKQWYHFPTHSLSMSFWSSLTDM